MRPIRNFTRPRTSASLLRGSVIANARTSSIVTTARRRSGYEPAVLGGRWRCLGLSPVWSPHLVISEEDIDKLASAARELEPSASVYLEQDFRDEPPRDRARLHAADRGRGDGARALPTEAVERSTEPRRSRAADGPVPRR